MKTEKKFSIPNDREVWATWRGGNDIPYLWGSRLEAIRNRDTDEVVVQLRIKFLRIEK